MFKNLFDFGMERSFLQAFGFYAFYFVLFLVIAFCSGMLIGVVCVMINPDMANPENKEKLFAIGQGFGVILSFTLSFAASILILVKKSEYKKPLNVILTIIGGTSALFLGAVTGLLVPAYFTTLKNQNGNSTTN